MTLVIHTSLVLGLLVFYTILGAIIIQLLEGGAAPETPLVNDVANDNTTTEAPPAIDEKQMGIIRDDVIKSILGATNALAATGAPKEVAKEPPAKGKAAKEVPKEQPNQGLVAIKSKLPEILKKELKKYETHLQSLLPEVEAEVEEATEEEPEVVEDPWDFFGSLFYCTTIYTTIGYGAVSPLTDAGRIFTIIYALVGIPLCLIVLDDFGKLLTRGLKKVWSLGFRTYQVDEDFNFMAPVALVITLVFILAGADMYRQWEDWEYIESIYFIFITISTVGFGDVLPACPGLFLLSYIYVLVGLALAGMTINIMMETVGRGVDVLQRRLLKTDIKTTKIE